MVDNNFRRTLFVAVALGLSLALIAIAPFVPVMLDNIMAWIIGVGAFITIFSLTKKNRFDTIFVFLITASFAVSWWIFPQIDQLTLSIRTCAITAFVLLNLVLLIGPWARFTKTIQKLYRHRRHMGVTVFLLGLMHFALIIGMYFNYSLENTFLAMFTFFGFTGLFVMFLLAITSWDWCQKHLTLKHWKIIHAVSLLLYIPFLVYALWVNISHNLQIDPYIYALLGSFVVFWIVVAPWGLAPKFIKYVMGWKQLHVLIYVAYVSLIQHVWMVSAEVMPLWLVISFWGLIAFVVGSHATGLFMKFSQEKALKDGEKNAEIIQEAGYDYICAGEPANFKENVGKKIHVNGKPVTVFKLKDVFYAWFAVCPHQKGPLERGKIVKGYLTCPWHQWQFSINDGKAPMGYKDCIPFYPTLLKNGKVYVRKTPQHKS